MSTTGKVVRAERFEVVDQAGNVRAALGHNDVSLTFTDAGVPSLSPSHSLTFYDLTGTPRAGIGISPEGGRSIMHLMGPGSAVALVVEEDGTAKIVLHSQHGQKIGLGLTPDGMATLSFFDAVSVLRASVMLDAEKEDGRLGLILRGERSQGQPCQPTAPPQRHRMSDYDAAVEIRDALTALKEEMGGVLVLTETVGVIAAQLIVMTDMLKRVLDAITSRSATTTHKKETEQPEPAHSLVTAD